LRKASEMLEEYLRRFELRLAPTNSENLNIFIRTCNSLISYTTNGSPKSRTINEFLFESGLDDINFYKIVRWIKESRLPYKVDSIILVYL